MKLPQLFTHPARLSLGLLSLLSGAGCSALGHQPVCSRCGNDAVQRRCQVISETKTVQKPEYSTISEEICMPEHRHCVSAQQVEGCVSDSTGLTPARGKIYTRTTLVKKMVDVEETKYKWVVVTECPCCSGQTGTCSPGTQ